MDSLNEDITALSCGYCGSEFGTWEIIIQENLLGDHECLKNCVHVNIDYGTGLIYNANIVDQENIVPPTPSENSSAVKSSPNGLKQSDYWTDDAVKLLIQQYKLHKEKFSSPCFTKKKVWEVISAELNKHGYTKTGVKCDEKWRNLKKNYDKVRNENGKTGNSTTTWKFYEDLQEIYWKDPQFIPIATASTSGMSIERNKEQKKFLSPGEKKIKHLSPEKHNNRLLKTNEIEARRQKRHEEKMKLKKEMFQWFKENFPKKKLE